MNLTRVLRPQALGGLKGGTQWHQGLAKKVEAERLALIHKALHKALQTADHFVQDVAVKEGPALEGFIDKSVSLLPSPRRLQRQQRDKP